MDLHIAQAAVESAGGITGWAAGLVDSLGGPGVALLVGLDYVLLPIPSDMVLPLVGISATQGAIGLGSAVAWSTAGSVAGALVMYSIGLLLGRVRTRALLTRIPGFKAANVDRSEAWFARHGAKAVVFGRTVPMLRSLISLPAGVDRMLPPKFLVLTALGGLMWNSTLLLGGYLLGANWHVIGDFAVFAPVLPVVVLVVVKLVRPKRRV
jgi:membrane protein DedA with SNARE-associated domain